MKKAFVISIISIVLTALIYLSLFFLLYSFKYKGKPLAYITNDYYNWKGGDTYAKFREFSKDKSYDMVFVGSSRAYRGYSPFIFEEQGYKAFNLGTSAQSVKSSFFIVKNYLNNENCRLLIFDIFSGTFLPGQLESSSDLIQNVDNIDVAKEISFDCRDARTMNMLVLRYLNEKDKAYFTKDDYTGKGYSANRSGLSAPLRDKLLKHGNFQHPPLKIDDEQIVYFKKMLDLVKEQKIKMVAVYSPVSVFYNNTAHVPLLEKIKPLMNEYKIPFYDFSNCDSISTRHHFYDESHLNEAGVRIFNAQLIRRLRAEKIIQ